MIVWFLLILIWTNTIEASHFNGGTITWAPVYPNTNSSPILITITQYYSWVYPTVPCATNIPTTGTTTNLICVGNCSTQNGYSNNPVSILTDCTSFSASLGIVFSQRSVNISLNESTYFWIGYRGSAWRSLQNAGSSAGWSIVSLIDLIRRPDGIINTPPVAQITSPQYVIFNETTVINIPVSDVNAGDDLRCRWSQQNSSYGVDECAAICASASVTSLANLTGCTLTFTGTTPGVWYALAMQVEDFINTTSTSPMSSVPIQFLIYVLPTPTCTQTPVIIPLTGCLDVQVNVPVTFTLYAMNYCNRTKVVITDLISTVNINGMSVSSLINSTTNTSLVYVTLTWTPQTSQLGSQQFCAVAYTSEKVQSTPYCVTLNVVTSALCTTTTTSTVTTTTATTTTSETTTTATTTTITTITTVTTTTDTTTTATTTTSETTTTQTTTTTITSSSNQINIPLIVGLSIVGLLLALCCSLFWLCKLKWSISARRRQLNKNKRILQQEIDTLSIKRDLTRIQRSSKSQNYTTYNELKTKETLNMYSSNTSIETKLTSIIDNPEVKKIEKSSEEENASMKSYPKQDSNENTAVVQKQTKSKRSSVTVSRIKYSSSASELIYDNESNKSTTDHHEGNKISVSSAKSNVFTLAKNKVSTFFETHANTASESNVSRIRSQSGANNLNNNKPTVIHISNLKLSLGSSNNIVKQHENQTSSARTNRSIVVKVKSGRSNQVGHTDGNIMRKRASSFGGTSVTSIKTVKKNSKSSANHPTDSIVLNDDKKSKTDHRVAVAFVKKEHS